MRPPPILSPFDTDANKERSKRPAKEWIKWIRQDLFGLVSLNVGNGTTSDRPVNGIKVSSHYFDTTLGIPIFYDGSDWIDAAGNSV